MNCGKPARVVPDTATTSVKERGRFEQEITKLNQESSNKDANLAVLQSRFDAVRRELDSANTKVAAQEKRQKQRDSELKAKLEHVDRERERLRARVNDKG